MRISWRSFCRLLTILLIGSTILAVKAWAAEIPVPALPSVTLNVGKAASPQEASVTIQVLLLLTILSLAPAIALMTTCFTRILVVLGFLKSALGIQQLPPNQVIVALALFLTFFIMRPTWEQIYADAYKPLQEGRISTQQAYERGIRPLREFMFRQTREKELSLMVSLSGMKRPEKPEDVPTVVLMPAFLISELKTAFQMGVVLFIPFLVIDMIVSSVLMAMGMIMLPPMLVSLPFKVLLFVLADGWDLLVVGLVKSFQ